MSCSSQLTAWFICDEMDDNESATSATKWHSALVPERRAVIRWTARNTVFLSETLWGMNQEASAVRHNCCSIRKELHPYQHSTDIYLLAHSMWEEKREVKNIAYINQNDDMCPLLLPARLMTILPEMVTTRYWKTNKATIMQNEA